ncbi:MAG: lipoyl protein ligase domain-containing protein [Microcoleaceae cyanobacterium]
MVADSNWRLIPLLKANGFIQMAIDEWLLEQHKLGKSPAVLRFYTWEPTAISLGYHQQRWPDFWQKLTWQDKAINLVRRPTGGRAVLHQGDLTYAVIAPTLPGPRLKTYAAICQFLIEGWQSLDVLLDYGSAGWDYSRKANCFSLATGADLVLTNGYKLIGSAQLKRDRSILQQGSIRLFPDPGLYSQVFGEELASPPPSVADLIAQPDFMQHLVNVLTTAASRCFQAEFVVQPLSTTEEAAIQAHLQNHHPQKA